MKGELITGSTTSESLLKQLQRTTHKNTLVQPFHCQRGEQRYKVESEHTHPFSVAFGSFNVMQQHFDEYRNILLIRNNAQQAFGQADYDSGKHGICNWENEGTRTISSYIQESTGTRL